jgi:hypothetical protein
MNLFGAATLMGITHHNTRNNNTRNELDGRLLTQQREQEEDRARNIRIAKAKRKKDAEATYEAQCATNRTKVKKKSVVPKIPVAQLINDDFETYPVAIVYSSHTKTDSKKNSNNVKAEDPCHHVEPDDPCV